MSDSLEVSELKRFRLVSGFGLGLNCDAMITIELRCRFFFFTGGGGIGVDGTVRACLELCFARIQLTITIKIRTPRTIKGQITFSSFSSSLSVSVSEIEITHHYGLFVL